uniref:Uncharacterized protein n=1 Tax=viral metagenome TaxID=1070528 RepID=A0A6M3KRN1_9ZZZZ
MDENQFRSAMRRAKIFQELYSNGYDFRSEFYAGVQRGLRRLYHGDDFGTEGEHRKWMSLSPWMKHDGPRVDWDAMSRRIEFGQRRMRGMGYRIGLNYENLTDPSDAQALRKILGWSVWEMSAWCGVSHRTVEGWEQGRPISDGPASKIRELLDV